MKEQVALLLKENQKLQQLNDEKTAWISLLSHDYKGVFANFQMLIDAYENQDISQDDFFAFLPQIKKDCKKNIQSINDTNTWIKYQQEGFHPQIISLSVVPLFELLKKDFQQQLEDKHLQYIYDGEKDVAIRSDIFLISFVLRKILENAIKYAYPAGTISFKVVQTDLQTQITITDQGIGMSHLHIKNLFSFESAVYQGTNGEIGAGLSLKIVKSFVQLLDGDIEIHSIESKTTSVSISLPNIKTENIKT